VNKRTPYAAVRLGPRIPGAPALPDVAVGDYVRTLIEFKEHNGNTRVSLWFEILALRANGFLARPEPVTRTLGVPDIADLELTMDNVIEVRTAATMELLKSRFTPFSRSRRVH
jgi:hypothetical protein